MEYSELYAMRIRQLCKQRGLSINKLADMSNVRQSSIDNIINGRPQEKLSKMEVPFTRPGSAAGYSYPY